MTTINKSALLPYTTLQMFALVDSIEQYPEFLPWCRQTEVHQRTDSEVTATIHVVKGGVHYSFTTHNRNAYGKEIEIRLVKGPFRHLEGFWRFEAVEDAGCRVSFDMKFEFTSKIIAFTAGPVLQKIAESFIDAFSIRAKAIYGKMLDGKS